MKIVVTPKWRISCHHLTTTSRIVMGTVMVMVMVMVTVTVMGTVISILL
jgi:hypothetical protein